MEYDEYYDDYADDNNGGDGDGDDDNKSQQEEESVENEYYNAKGHEEDGHAADALEAFEKVITLEEEQEGEKGEWGFKALKHIVKIHFAAKKYKEMMRRYKEMLGYIKKSVSRNKSDKTINSLLDTVAAVDNLDLLLEFYDATLRITKEVSNERLWLKTYLKQARLWLERKEYAKVSQIVDESHAACRNPDGSDDQRKATALLEIYALRIQVHDAHGEFDKMREAYSQVTQVKNALPSPQINGVIREAGGKIHGKDGKWSEAYRSFFDAFHSFDEAGAVRRLQCLKYTVFANMMMMSKIDPFESQETGTYKTNPEIVPAVALVKAYQACDVEAFDRALREHRDKLVDDFVEQFVPQLFVNIRTQLLMRLIVPYTAVRLTFLASRLDIQQLDVERMLVQLILDHRISARIDQVGGRLLVGSADPRVVQKYEQLYKWAEKISSFQRTIVTKVA